MSLKAQRGNPVFDLHQRARERLGSSFNPPDASLYSAMLVIHIPTAVMCAFWVLAGTIGIAGAAELIVPGTGDGLEMLRHLAAAYREKNPATNVIFPDSIGSGGGKLAVAQDRAVLGRIAVPLTASDEAVGLVAVPVVRVPTVFYSHPSLRIANLTTRQITDIFAGNVRSWSEVGGPDLRIRLVRREDADSTLQVLRATLPGWKDLVISDRSKTAVTTQEAFETVAHFEGAIGFGPYSPVVPQQFNVIAIDGKHPTSATYPSFTSIRLIFKRDQLTEEAGRFVEFATSSEARRIFVSYGGIPEPPRHSPAN
jgi:phosphate transport system substrate-binding protein